METVLSLIRSNWMLWLVGAGSKLALLVAALFPRWGVSWSVGELVLCVGGVVFIGHGGGCAVIRAVGPPRAAYFRWPVLSLVGLVGSS